LEDYLQRAESVEEVQVEQIEEWMKRRGEELDNTVLDCGQNSNLSLGIGHSWIASRSAVA